MKKTIENELATIAALKKAGDHTRAHSHAIECARVYSNDVRAQVAAAYACDRLGLENEAIPYYEAALKLGVPVDERQKFLLGFGSTLRNVSRVDEAVARLTEALREYPDNAALRAFLSLALHSAGKPELALAMMLESALTAARPEAFGPYSRALNEYKEELAATQRPTLEGNL